MIINTIPNAGHWLQAENPQYAPIILCEGQELEIWGVVSHVVHKP